MAKREHGRSRKEPLLRPRRALCAGRRQCRRRGGALCRAAAYRRRANRAGEASALASALGNLKGPLMKVAQLMATIPDLLAAGIRRRIAEAAERSAADGLGLRQTADDRRAWARLAEQIRDLRAPSGRGRLARPGASRSLARRRGAGLQAAISRHAVGGRSRSAATAMAPRHPPPPRYARSTPARSARRSASGCARSSIIGAKPSMSRSTAPCLTASTSCACRAPGRNCRPAAC